MSALNRSETDPYRGISLILLIILVSPIAISCAARFMLQDFSIYWYATARWLAGSNPYELPDLVSYMGGDVGVIDFNINKLKVWAPPYFLFMMMPFAVLGLTVGKMLYLACLLSSLAGWIFLTSRELGAKVFARQWWYNATLIPLALMVSPWCVTRSTLLFGGMSVLASTAFLVLATTRNFASFSRWLLFWLLVSIKPHAVFGAAVAFMVLLPARERWRSLSALGAAGMLFGLGLLIYSPQVFDQFFALDSSVVHLYQSATQTLVGRLLTFGMSVNTGYLVSGSLWLISLVPLLKVRRSLMGFREIVAVAIMFNTLSIYLSPYAWIHDYQTVLGLLWATLVVGVRSGILAVVNIALFFALNLWQISLSLLAGESHHPSDYFEMSFWSLCAALYAMLSCINIIWISNNSRANRVA